MEEKITDFKISKGKDSNRRYIFSNYHGVYLQIDGTIRNDCAYGWFDNEEEAQKCLDKYMEEKITDFKIKYAGCLSNNCYIYSSLTAKYLQCDGTPCRQCGSGWFESKEEAQKCLDKYMGKNTLNLPEGMPQPPELPDGYEYVNRGWAWEASNVTYIYYGNDKWFNFNPDKKSFANGVRAYYYLEIIKKETKEKVMSLEEQIKFAKSLVGKRIALRAYGKSTLITNIFISDEIYGHMNLNSKKECEEILKKQDIFVMIQGDNYGRPILPTSKPEDFEIQKEVEVNGYIAEDMGNYYKFGCAEISYKQLQRAKKFLEECSGTWSNSNRDVKSVRIGDGEFTLELLNQLV
jgi:hypothetical protein